MFRRWVPWFLAGMFAIMVGVWLSGPRSWRSEPGLWMLSALNVVMCGALALMLTYRTINDLAERTPVGTLVDEGVATLLLWSLVCVSSLITRWSWSFSRAKPTRQLDVGVGPHVRRLTGTGLGRYHRGNSTSTIAVSRPGLTVTTLARFHGSAISLYDSRFSWASLPG